MVYLRAGQMNLVSIQFSYLAKLGWPYSLPRPTRPCRGIELSLFATDYAFHESAQCTCQCHFVWFSFAFNIDSIPLLTYYSFERCYSNCKCSFAYYSDRLNRWWKTVYIRSFHLSVLLREYSPNVERFTFPLVWCRTHPHWARVGCPLVGVRWAESGGWHDASWNDLPLDVWSIQTVVFYSWDFITDL